MSKANLLYCNSSLLAWLDSRTLHNLCWIIKVSRLDKQHENDLTRCVFANRVWNLNKLNNKSKFIHHGDMTVIRQPVISCWAAYGEFTLLSSIESVFFKVVQSVCHSAVTQQTHTRQKITSVGFTWCRYFCWTYIRHHMGQVLSFYESDLIRD